MPSSSRMSGSVASPRSQHVMEGVIVDARSAHRNVYHSHIRTQRNTKVNKTKRQKKIELIVWGFMTKKIWVGRSASFFYFFYIYPWPCTAF